jgi:acyl-CoA thioester hydrolase
MTEPATHGRARDADVPPGAVHRTSVQMRFADTDALGHVNNGSFVVYTEIARLDFFRAIGSEVRSLILARIAVDFRKQVLFDAEVSVDTWVDRIGTTSVTLQQVIRANDVVATEIESVVVSYDYERQRSSPWTPETRATLERYRR